EALTEVLREPAWSQNGPADAGVAHGLFGGLEGMTVVGLADAVSRQQHQPPYARGDRFGHEPGDARTVVDARPQLGLDQVGGGDALDRGRPGRWVAQVEGDVTGGAGRGPYWMAGGLETPRDAATGLAGAAEDEDVLHSIQETPELEDDPWENVGNTFVIVYR